MVAARSRLGDDRVTIQTDDGARLWLDGQLIHDRWKDQGATTYRVSRSLGAGEREVRLEYYENGGGAVARPTWRQDGGTAPPTPTSGRPAATGSGHDFRSSYGG